MPFVQRHVASQKHPACQGRRGRPFRLPLPRDRTICQYHPLVHLCSKDEGRPGIEHSSERATLQWNAWTVRTGDPLPSQLGKVSGKPWSAAPRLVEAHSESKECADTIMLHAIVWPTSVFFQVLPSVAQS